MKKPKNETTYISGFFELPRKQQIEIIEVVLDYHRSNVWDMMRDMIKKMNDSASAEEIVERMSKKS